MLGLLLTMSTTCRLAQSFPFAGQHRRSYCSLSIVSNLMSGPMVSVNLNAFVVLKVKVNVDLYSALS